jgi:hypothetical protein
MKISVHIRTTRRSVTAWSLFLGLTLAGLAAPVPAEEPDVAAAPADTSLALSGDQEGTVFKSLTIEGENRVQVHFERPELVVDLDPSQAPGLTWGSSMDILNRTVPDLTTPLLASSAHLRSPYRIRPWLTAYRTGPVATFRSDLKKVHRWTLLVVDSRGREIVQFAGKKNPPRELEWDGRQQDGTLALPGLTYSYVLEAYDKAGNKRRFVGDGFELEAYRRERDDTQEFLIAGNCWREAAREASPVPSAYLLETASWVNMKTAADEVVLITATAGTYAEARALGDQVATELKSLLPGDDARVAVSALAEPGSPPGGTLHIQAGGREAATKN